MRMDRTKQEYRVCLHGAEQYRSYSKDAVIGKYQELRKAHPMRLYTIQQRNIRALAVGEMTEPWFVIGETRI